MNRPIRTLTTAAALALGLFAAAGAANASPATVSVQFISSAPAPYVYSQPVQVMPGRPVAMPQPVYDDREWDRPRRHAMRDACDAERWNPRERYMPGDTVRRHGEIFVARRVSAQVWNVNSPPEWTPNYWAPARCR